MFVSYVPLNILIYSQDFGATHTENIVSEKVALWEKNNCGIAHSIGPE